ncbi:MAG: UDP-N-acetylmuramoyl-L-alanine--D-glutamate ligase [Cytophagales bacterium]|nr:MAG: UDP-N-acetylmuramoyl-L-alanine--D-glutamate ligase [Cytophagales bacterium]TAF62375.1 MAG: UDP-N-acetylmuramoyl-L-alanine--D-glutamate ligase [Cytophagales bacterium]
MVFDVVVLGGGESGVGSALLAKGKGKKVFLSDGGSIPERYLAVLQEADIPYEQGQHSLNKILATSLVVKSPGIPESASIMKTIRHEGIPVFSEMEWAFSFLDKAKIVGITGTNGKTTTTLLTYHLFKASGRNVCLAGNVGISFAKAVLEGTYDEYVLEISSFQLDDVYKFHCNIALLLNITPDHLDRYNYDMREYIASKFKIFDKQQANDCFIFNAEDSNIAQNPLLCTHTASVERVGIDLRNLQSPARIENGFLVVGDLRLALDELPLKGPHNEFNMAAAILAAQKAGIPDSQIAQHIKTFVNAPHRLEQVAIKQGVKYVNDSKATNVDAVFYALQSFKEPIVWIAGGVDKGNQYALIEPLVRKHVKALVCLGKDNKKLLAYFKDLIPLTADTDSLAEAIQKATSFAQDGDVVLLSPACASFDLFKNYEDRGNQFRAFCQNNL